MTSTTFRQLDLAESSLSAVKAAGYENPTEIQTLAIPPLLEGRDIVATAQTGTGKTAAFVLPLLQRVKPTRKDTKRACPTALILTPTRELATQIVENVTTYGRESKLSVVAIYGGASRNKQIDQLKRRPDILVATPGRLEDLIADKYIDLSGISYLVLDEADRMLDMGFIPAVRRICSMIPGGRQTALFSATMPGPIEDLAQQFLDNPVRVAAEEGESRVEQIDQSVMWIDQANKLEYLPQLIKDRGMYRVLVFTRTKHRARKVAKILSRSNLDSDSIHGDKSQSARQRALKGFADGKIHVLVATDVASRGIDVDDVTHVVNFEIPNEPETYVHRIGRTGRAGNVGVAISLCDATEMPYVSSIEKLLGSSIRVDKDQPFHAERVVKQPRGGSESRGGRGSGRGGVANSGGSSRRGGSSPRGNAASPARGNSSQGSGSSAGGGSGASGGASRGGSRRGGSRRRRGGSGAGR